MKARLTLLLLCACLSAHAAEPTALSDKMLDRLVQRLEDTGKLDAALERTLQRLGQKQQEAKRKQQEARLAEQKAMSKDVKKPDPKRDHFFGPANAEVTLIEFSDYECPYCKRFHGTPEEVVKRLEGRANLVWRHFPLEFHNPAAQVEAQAAECAGRIGGEDTFWAYTNQLIKRTLSNGKGMPVTVKDEHPLLTLAGELKVSKDAFKACMDKNETRERVMDDMADGINAGVEGTPAVILYHHKSGRTDFIGGGVSVEALEAAVRKLLAE